MKNLFKVLVVVLVPFLFYLMTGFFSSGEEKKVNKNEITTTLITPTGGSQKDFLNFIFNFHYNPDPVLQQQWVENQFANYNLLNYNALHIYGGFIQNGLWDFYNMGSDRYGRFGPVLNQDHIDNTNLLMNNIGRNGFKGIYGRIKIEALCYGQRVIYEAENGNNDFCYSRRYIRQPEL